MLRTKLLPFTHAEDKLPEGALILAKLLACDEFWHLLEFHIGQDERERAIESKDKFGGKLMLEPRFSAVRFTRDLLIVGCACVRQFVGHSQVLRTLKTKLKESRRPYDDALNHLEKAAKLCPKYNGILSVVADSIREDRDHFPFVPDRITTKGTATSLPKSQAMAAAIREVERRIPDSYSKSDRQATTTAIVKAFGITLSRWNYRDIAERDA